MLEIISFTYASYLMPLKTRDEILSLLNAAIRNGGTGEKISAADVRGFLTVVIDELLAGHELTESQLSALTSADFAAQLTQKADLLHGLVPASQLPSYVDDVREVATYAKLPSPGEAGTIYVALDDNRQYRWGGSAYVLLSDAGLTGGELAAVHGAHTPSEANPFATLADVAASNTAKAIRVVAATRERVFYSGVGTAANPKADGLSQALAAATAGDTVVQVTNAAIAGLLKDSEQVLLKPGVSYDTAGFDISSLSGGDAITLPNSGSGKLFGRHSTVYVGAGGWGLGWYYGPGPVYKLYDLHFYTAVNATCIGVFSQGDLYVRGDITLTTAGKAIQMWDWHSAAGYARRIEHEGNIYLRGTGAGIVAYLSNPGQSTNTVTRRGNMVVQGAGATLGSILNGSVLHVYGGVLDLREAVAAGAFGLDAASVINLYDVTALGFLPVRAAVAGQAKGAIVRLYGATVLPAGLAWDAELTIEDYRPGAMAGPATKSLPVFTVTSSGAQTFTLPTAATGVANVQVRRSTGTTETLWLPQCSVAGTSLTISAEAKLDSGDQITGTYY